MSECPAGTHSMFDFCPGDCGKPLTAREILMDLPVYGVHGEREAGEAIDAFAHELAEKIRAERLEKTSTLLPSYAEAWGDGRDHAANLIDPEVSDG